MDKNKNDSLLYVIVYICKRSPDSWEENFGNNTVRFQLCVWLSITVAVANFHIAITKVVSWEFHLTIWDEEWDFFG